MSTPSREKRRVKTTKARHGKDVFRKAGSKGGIATWQKIKKMTNPLEDK